MMNLFLYYSLKMFVCYRICSREFETWCLGCLEPEVRHHFRVKTTDRPENFLPYIPASFPIVLYISPSLSLWCVYIEKASISRSSQRKLRLLSTFCILDVALEFNYRALRYPMGILGLFSLHLSYFVSWWDLFRDVVSSKLRVEEKTPVASSAPDNRVNGHARGLPSCTTSRTFKLVPLSVNSRTPRATCLQPDDFSPRISEESSSPGSDFQRNDYYNYMLGYYVLIY